MLKRKYRQLLQEREARHPRADADTQGRPSRGAAPWDGTEGAPVSSGRSDAQVNLISGQVDEATALQNPKVSESTTG